MSKLGEDVLFLISENLKDDIISLYSCLLVNTVWCKTMVPNLWKIPGRIPLTKKANDILFNVILLHLSEESRDTLKIQGINIITETSQRPLLFNYIGLWKWLNLELLLETMIISKNIEKSKMSIIRNEILKLFINRNTKFNYFYIPNDFDHQLLYDISWAESCFSELEFFNYNNMNQNILKELAKVSKSIKKLIIHLIDDDISGIVRLIEAQKNLSEVHIFCYSGLNYESLKTVEKSLIKNATSIQSLTMGWKPIITKFLLYFVNLKSLVMEDNIMENYPDWCQMSLPVLKALRTSYIPANFLVRLIESTSGHLTTISIFCEVILYKGADTGRLIQAIYQNCPNLRYLETPIKNCNFPEFKRLLTNCQDLNGLIIIDEKRLNYEELFSILTESSPKSLFKFKFIFNKKFGNKLTSLKSIFDNWKDRKPILLQIDLVNCFTQQEEQEMKDIIEKYKAKEIIKRFDLNVVYDVEEFEWVQE
ncbi:hypothetical protein RhiirA4_462759 [Rhizophagus irregularis]|uniref:F-box domain-containing protein n=1 Tax=Rhizophagus irregularis TaxID=588596 RepID=A0A2I1GLN5_9GLOM|nr:hypothetical protein RhiirA4_462759 [Rhizophagus irregularis]